MKIELKKIKHAEYLSEETNAYSAEVWVDGKLVAYVSNAGHGGCDHQTPAKGYTMADIDALNKRCIEHFGERQFPIRGDSIETFSYPMTLEHVCSDLLTAWLKAKEVNRMRRRFASKIIFSVDGQLRELGYKGVKNMSTEQVGKLRAHVLTRFPKAMILNDLNDDQILAVL